MTTIAEYQKQLCLRLQRGWSVVEVRGDGTGRGARGGGAQGERH